MITIGISEFRVNISKLLKQVEEGEIISLTHRGREVARVIPPSASQLLARQQLEEIRKDATVGDVLSPIEADWQVDQG